MITPYVHINPYPDIREYVKSLKPLPMTDCNKHGNKRDRQDGKGFFIDIRV